MPESGSTALDEEVNWFDLGTAYGKEGDTAKAIECYSKCLVLNPKSHRAALSVAMAYEKQQQMEKAAEFYTRALSLTDDLSLKEVILRRISITSHFIDTNLPHSGFGIASFVIGLLVDAPLIVLWFVTFCIAVMAGGVLGERVRFEFFLIHLLLFCPVAFLGLIMAGLGLYLPGRKKNFAQVGLFLNLTAMSACAASLIIPAIFR